MASFAVYGFHKVANARQIDKQMIAFQHPDFIRGDTTRLQRIKRNLPRHRTTVLGPYERLISPFRLQERSSKEPETGPLIAHMETTLDDLERKLNGVHSDLRSFKSMVYNQQQVSLSEGSRRILINTCFFLFSVSSPFSGNRASQTLNRMIEIFSSSDGLRLPQSSFIQSRLAHIQQHRRPQYLQHPHHHQHHQHHQHQSSPDLPLPPIQGSKKHLAIILNLTGFFLFRRHAPDKMVQWQQLITHWLPLIIDHTFLE